MGPPGTMSRESHPWSFKTPPPRFEPYLGPCHRCAISNPKHLSLGTTLGAWMQPSSPHLGAPMAQLRHIVGAPIGSPPQKPNHGVSQVPNPSSHPMLPLRPKKMPHKAILYAPPPTTGQLSRLYKQQPHSLEDLKTLENTLRQLLAPSYRHATSSSEGPGLRRFFLQAKNREMGMRW